MRSFGRIALLAVRFNWASKARFVLLTLVVAVGMTVFLLISELSRVSSEDLDEAIAQDLGATGTYLVDIQSHFGLGPDGLRDRVTTALRPFEGSRTLMLEVLPPLPVDCPPSATLGEQAVMIVQKAEARAVDLPLGGGGSPDAGICLGGQQIDPSEIHVLNEREQLTWGPGVLVSDRFERVAVLSTNDAPTYRFVMLTDRQANEQEQIASALQQALGIAATRFGLDQGEAVAVQRLDSAEEIRRASAGVKLVYSIIAWGVLILGGLGLLVAEMIVVRDRTWFYGLSRAVGGRSTHIIGLILADVVLVLLAGTALAGVLVAALQPAAASFARDTFQVGVRLLQPDTVPRLFVGELIVLILAGLMPALKATRQDPLDVLEPSVV
jgi:hypothetical protein